MSRRDSALCLRARAHTHTPNMQLVNCLGTSHVVSTPQCTTAICTTNMYVSAHDKPLWRTRGHFLPSIAICILALFAVAPVYFVIHTLIAQNTAECRAAIDVVKELKDISVAIQQLPHNAAVRQGADPMETTTHQYNGTFHYVCEPPCEIQSNFFDQGPEQQIKEIFLKHLRGKHGSLRALDIGMNSGYFTLLSASYGAQVMAFDPQPACIGIMRAALQRSENAHVKSNIKVLNVAVGNVGKIHANHHQCGGDFQGNSKGAVESDIAVVPLSSVWTMQSVDDYVDIVKVDTEGAEVTILEQLLPYVNKKLVGAIVVEVAPPWWNNRGSTTEQGIHALIQMQKAAKETYLLMDPTPFAPTVAPVKANLERVTPPILTKVNMTLLVNDRITQNVGCNIYFEF